MFSPFATQFNDFETFSPAVMLHVGVADADALSQRVSQIRDTVYKYAMEDSDDADKVVDKVTAEVEEMCDAAKKLHSIVSESVTSISQSVAHIERLDTAKTLIMASLSRASTEIFKVREIVQDDELASAAESLANVEASLVGRIDASRERLMAGVKVDGELLKNVGRVFLTVKGSLQHVTCAVCMERPVDQYLHPCGHTLCSTCLPKCGSRCHFCLRPALPGGKLFFS